MGNLIRFVVAVLAFVVAGASPARAQEASLIGSLDCQVVYPAAVVQAYRKLRCLYLPSHGQVPGFRDLIGSLSPMGPPPSGRRVVWGVYGLDPYSSLPGTYVKRSGMRVLARGIATELRPIADVPGEEVGRNLAFDADRLTLTLP